MPFLPVRPNLDQLKHQAKDLLKAYRAGAVQAAADFAAFHPDKVAAANPVRYISAADPPMLILHGNSDQLVPHNQGEQLYMALNKACRDAVFISLPKAPHGNWNGFLTDDALHEQFLAGTPMRRAGEPEDIACAVLYLVSDAASWVTGKVFEVDGGSEIPAFKFPTTPL